GLAAPNAGDPVTYSGGAYSAKPATSPSTYRMRPHRPQSRSTADSQSSFADGSGSRSPLSQNAHERHGAGRSSALSTVTGTSLRAMAQARPGAPMSPRRFVDISLDLLSTRHPGTCLHPRPDHQVRVLRQTRWSEDRLLSPPQAPRKRQWTHHGQPSRSDAR